MALANQLPGPASAGSRLDLSRANLHLIGDFPFTGGGLDSFPGLYAHYIRGLPFFQLDHGHNLYLDVALEQGLLGAFALISLLLGTLWLLWPQLKASNLLAWGTLASLLVMGSLIWMPSPHCSRTTHWWGLMWPVALPMPLLIFASMRMVSAAY